MPIARLLSSFAAMFVAVLTATPAHAEIYACIARNRLPVYQNFPCQFDRLADAPAPTGVSHASATAATAQAARGTTASATAATLQAARLTASAPRPATPRVGMTTADVRAIWGNPQSISKEELARKDIETWSYADSRSIEFDRKGIVTAIRW